jgi:hypothetical protein
MLKQPVMDRIYDCARYLTPEHSRTVPIVKKMQVMIWIILLFAARISTGALHGQFASTNAPIQIPVHETHVSSQQRIAIKRMTDVYGVWKAFHTKNVALALAGVAHNGVLHHASLRSELAGLCRGAFEALLEAG